MRVPEAPWLSCSVRGAQALAHSVQAHGVQAQAHGEQAHGVQAHGAQDKGFPRVVRKTRIGEDFVSAKLPQGEEEGKKEVDEEQGEEGKNKEEEFILSLMLIKRLISTVAYMYVLIDINVYAD